jgi:hypothetical protein
MPWDFFKKTFEKPFFPTSVIIAPEESVGRESGSWSFQPSIAGRVDPQGPFFGVGVAARVRPSSAFRRIVASDGSVGYVPDVSDAEADRVLTLLAALRRTPCIIACPFNDDGSARARYPA